MIAVLNVYKKYAFSLGVFPPTIDAIHVVVRTIRWNLRNKLVVIYLHNFSKKIKFVQINK